MQRNIPLSVRLKVLWLNPGSIFNILLMLAGILPILFLFADANMKAILLGDSAARTVGTVQGIEATNTSVNEERILKYYYEYVVDGELYLGASYDTYREVAAGDKVDVLYSESDPYASKIQGMDPNIVPLFVYVVLIIVFLIGLGLQLRRMKRRRRELKLVETGELSTARLVKKEATNTEINNERVYRLYFEYVYNGIAYEIVKKTHKTQYLEDEEEERLIFMPDHPEEAVLWDALPGALWGFLENRQ